MRSRVTTFFALMLLASVTATTGGTGFLRVGFTRSVYQPSGGAPDVVQGSMYYTPTGVVHIEVTSPVSQLISLTGTQMSIYYPKERKAFIFESKNPLTLPFASAFLGSTRESFGLPDLGFTAASVTQRGDSVISTWNPPSVTKQAVDRVVLTEVNGDIVLTESYTSKGSLSTRATFKKYISIKQGRVPLEIYNGWQTSKGWTKEVLLFASPSTIPTLPAHLNNFTIPSDVVPRKVQW